MYLERSTGNRDGWKFTYLGKDLLPFAEKKYEEFVQREGTARDKMAKLLKDRTIAHNDKKVVELEQEISFCGPEREKCSVWKFEFHRNLEREYHLSMGDVVYFGIAE